MPTYQYVCAAGHAFEQVQKMSDPPIDRCPTCGAVAERRLSGGSGLIFKGSGFYITDYGKDGKGPRKDAESAPKPAAEAASPAPAPAPTKPSGSADSK